MREEHTSRVTFDEIADFVAELRPCRRDRLSPDTTLAQDLGMDGDEAFEFFEAFALRYSVDLTAMQWERHFVPESWMLNPFVLLWPPCWRRINIKKRAVRLADLVTAANARRWTFAYDKIL